MADYSRLTKTELIRRLEAFEAAAGTPSAPEISGAGVEERTGALEALNRALQAEVDEHKRSLEALGESEARLRAILQTAIEAIVTIDEKGVIESINPAAERMFGYSAAEVVGKNVSVLMPEPYRRDHNDYVAEYRRTGHARVIGIGRETVAQHKDGTVFPIDLSVSEVRLSNRQLFTGFVRDITDRKRLEARQKIRYSTTRALAESATLEEAAQKIIASVCIENGWGRGELWTVDADANVLRYVDIDNPSDNELREFSARAPELCFEPGQGFPGTVWKEKKARWIADVTQEPDFVRVREACKEGVHSAFAFPILLADQVHGVMAFFSREIKEPDTGLLQMFADIGSQVGQFIRRKRAEQRLGELARSLAEKNKELETIVYVASHDLRSPLVNVQGFSGELIRACERVHSILTRGGGPLDSELETILAREIPEAGEYIRASVAKMDSLLSGFLRFSRLGRAALRIERLKMKNMLVDIIRTIDFQIQQAKAEVRLNPVPECFGDAIQINQVFSNLLDNALKYLDSSRRGLITISGHVDRGRAIFSIADNGIGIAADHKDRIFEMFHRLNPSKGEGEGLGLSIAQRSLERQNGKIWVESELGKGSVFYVSLPAVAGRAEAEA